MPGTTLDRSWFRPALMILTAAAPTEDNAVNGSWNIGSVAGTDYLFLSDDNRSDLQIGIQRIEYKKRMINGRMRSYHVADKKTFSVSWSDFPSSASFVSENRQNPTLAWGAGKEIVSWHEDHPDSFYLMLVYDTPNPEGTGSIPLRYKVETYNVFFESVTYNIKTRGAIHDHWDLSVSMVEV
jgi:hypothetical protein